MLAFLLNDFRALSGVTDHRETTWVVACGKVVVVFETVPINGPNFPTTNVVVHEVRDVSLHLDV